MWKIKTFLLSKCHGKKMFVHIIFKERISWNNTSYRFHPGLVGQAPASSPGGFSASLSLSGQRDMVIYTK